MVELLELTQSERLKALETYRMRDAKGSYTEDEGATPEEAEFEYYEYPSTAVKVLRKQELGEEERSKLAETYNSLGLKDIAFNCYSRDTEFKENIASKHVYVLAHGWTGNKDIYSEVQMSGGLSVVEQIMAMDPDAVIITPDGNGFGGTNFRGEVLQDEEFGKYCTAEAYAKQMDFLIKEVLDIDPSTVTIVGHSMGGAMTYEIMRLGYKNGVAIAPAAFPSKESLEEISTKAKETNIENILKKHGINISSVIYDVISGGINLGESIRNLGGEIAQPIIDGIISKVFNTLTPYLMGKNIEGIKDIDIKIIEKLVEIHAKEVTPEKYKVVSEAIKQLGNGTNYDTWTEEDFGNTAKVDAFSGTADVLVQPKDFEANEVSLLINAVGTTSEQEVATTVSKNLKEQNKIAGGHYAGVYNSRVIAAIVRKGKEKNK